MKTNIIYYEEPSGIDWPKLAIALGMGLVISFILGFIYGVITRFFPFPYFLLFITIGFGISLGYCSRLVARIAKLTGKTNKLLLTLGVVAFGCYVQWIVYLLPHYFGDEISFGHYISHIPWILSPDLSFFHTMGMVNEVGAWSINGLTVTGLLLTAVWVMELALILVMAYKYSKSNNLIPYSVDHDKWYKKYTLSDQFVAISSKSFAEKEIGMNGVNSFVDGLDIGDGHRHGKVHIYKLENAPYQYLSYEKIMIENRGKGRTLSNFIINNLRITNTEGNTILSKYNNKQEKIDIF